MTLANLTSPMNPEHLSPTVIGAPAALAPALVPALPGLAAGGRPPGL